MKFFAKVYQVEKELIVAACDCEVHGKSFGAGKVVVEVNEEFYGTELYDKDAIIGLLKEATILNLVGERIVNLAIEIGLVEKENIIKLGDTLHAQMVTM